MQKGNKMRITFVLALLVTAVLAVASPALAQTSPTGDAYGGVLGSQQSGGSGNAPSAAPAGTQATQAASGSSLPFTGADMTIVLLAGGALVGLGFGLRWATRRQTDA